MPPAESGALLASGPSEVAAMPIELNAGTPLAATRVQGAGQIETRPAVSSGSPSTTPVAVDLRTRQSVEPSQALNRASRAAARAMFKDRDVEITSFQDEGTGRIVYRVTDRSSGELLHQSPPDALLRFFASSRAALGEPIVAIEA